MKKLFVLLGLVLCSIVSVSAWDDAGHKLSAYIAWQRMTPEVRETAVKILLAAPEDSDLSVFYLQDSRSENARKLELFMIAATWADIVRERKFDVRYKKYHKGNWHYSDTFWKQINGKVENVEGMEEGGKAVEKLYEFEKVLRDPVISDQEKAIALAWILHLGGDIHQPLHTSARITDLEPKGDQGGNLFLLNPVETPRNQSENLHWFWDSIIGRNIPRENDACDSDYLFPIANQIIKANSFDQAKKSLSLNNFDNWQKESFAYNPTDVFSADLIRYQKPSEKYKKNALKVAEKQLAMAGYRLGEMLNQILGNNQTASVSTKNEAKEDCKIIRRAEYPISMTRSENPKYEISLINFCHSATDIQARPMYPMMVNGEIKYRAYSIERIFKTEKEARDYAAQNGITDVSF